MWISAEQSVMICGIVYVFMGFVVLIGHVQLSLLIMGGGTGALATIESFIIFLILLEMAERCLHVSG